MAGLEIVVGYLIAWAVRKARRVGGRLDDDVDLVMDAELNQIHDLVAEKLGLDPRSRNWRYPPPAARKSASRAPTSAGAFADAVEADDQFAGALQELLCR